MPFTKSLFHKLLLTAAALIVIAVATLDIYITDYVAGREKEQVRERMARNAALAQVDLRHFQGRVTPDAGVPDWGSWAKQIADGAQARVTLVDANGKVLADSDGNAASMENHAARPEFRRALQGQTGEDDRRSATLNQEFFYYAVPTPGSHPVAAFRLAVPLERLDRAATAVRERLVATSLGVLMAAMALAWVLSRRFSARVERLEAFAHQMADRRPVEPLRVDSLDELGSLGHSLNRTQQQLRDYVADLERLERVRRDFVSNASHELRTPISAIQGYVETLLDGAIDDQANNRRFLETVRVNAIRLKDITADLLILSEIEAGAPQLLESFSLRSAVESAVRAAGPEAISRQVELIEEEIPDVRIHGSRLRMEQALINLLTNAAKFNRPGGTVRVGARMQGGEGRGESRMVELSVADTGIGIPEGEQSRIFERFYRVDKAHSRSVGGTGLGLAIVRHAVEAMGGAVRVSSVVGEGSRFTVTLPAQPN
jgi:signal transduction histidine kinase